MSNVERKVKMDWEEIGVKKGKKKLDLFAFKQQFKKSNFPIKPDVLVTLDGFQLDEVEPILNFLSGQYRYVLHRRKGASNATVYSTHTFH
jgi:hypothetical protein